MTRHAKFSLGTGTQYLLVHQSAARRLDEDEARRMLRQACEDRWNAHSVLELARRHAFDQVDDLEAAIAIVARLLASQALVCVTLEPELGTSLVPAIRGERSDSWDRIPYLHELGSRSDPAPRPPAPPRREPAPSPTPPPSPPVPLETYVAFDVVDQDGARIRGRYRWTIDAAAREGDLTAASIRVEPVAQTATVHLTLTPTGYLASSRAAPPSNPPAESTSLAIAAELGPLSLPVGTTTTIVVQVPKATVFTVPAYELDLEVFRPGWLWFDEARNQGTSGLGCVAQVLAFGRAHPERYVLVVGHTDTTGSKAHNRGVAQRRAEHLAALLRADVDAWVASCEADGELADLAAHVQWAASRFGWACDGGVPSTLTTALRDALAEYRRRAAELVGIHVDPEREPCSDDWRLAYALFDVALAEELDLDLAALAALRAGLRWCEPAMIGAGELWPRALVGKDGKKSAVNRRTEVLFATVAEIPGGAGDPVGDSLYGDDAWLWLDYIDPEFRAVLPLSLVSTDGHAVPRTPFKIVSDAGRVRYGLLGPDGKAVLDDVAAGEFRVHYLDHDDVTTKVWAARFDAAQRDADTATIRRLLGLPAELVRAIAVEYGTRFAGGDPDALVQRARSSSSGGPDEVVVDFLLALAGFTGEVEYDTSLLQPPRGNEVAS